MEPRITIEEIIKTTPRAYLCLCAAGKTFWVPRKAMGEDGTVSEKVYQSGLAFTERLNNKKAARLAARGV